MGPHIEMSGYSCDDGQVSITQASIQITMASQSQPVEAGECFDLQSCCDEAERRVIEQLRSYLRPQSAPACLIERLRLMFDNVEIME